MNTQNTNKAQPRKRSNPIDWEAIERDYRLGRMTLRELAEKHGTRNETIGRRITRDRAADPSRWCRDLSDQVRAAASALLVQEAVSKASAEGQQATATGVLAAAEVIRGVISSHRKDVVKARSVAAGLLEELDTLPARMDDLKAAIAACAGDDDEKRKQLEADLREAARLHARIGSAQKLADTMLKLQAIERRAHSIPDEGPSAGGDFDDMTDAELDARIDALMAKRGA